jgi:hypothetical protein
MDGCVVGGDETVGLEKMKKLVEEVIWIVPNKAQ